MRGSHLDIILGGDRPDHHQALSHLRSGRGEAGGVPAAPAGDCGGSEGPSGVPETAGGERQLPQPGHRGQPGQRPGDDGGVQDEHDGAEEHDLRGVRQSLQAAEPRGERGELALHRRLLLLLPAGDLPGDGHQEDGRRPVVPPTHCQLRPGASRHQVSPRSRPPPAARPWRWSWGRW